MRLTRFNKLTNEYEYCLDNPNTTIVQDEIAGIQKLGEYENIDTDPKHLAKIKQALRLSISKQVNWKLLAWSKKLDEYNDNVLDISMKLTQEEYNLVKEVLNYGK